MKILTIVGARPQFVKAAVISRLIRSNKYKNSISEIIVHTGQHYDANMSGIFFDEMRIPKPDINLGIGGKTHGAMTGAMLEGIEKTILENKPDLLLVYGDTNSTMAGSLAASKLHVPVAHIEAGLRSYNKKMPEEQNRILTDHLSTFLFCPTDTAVKNLRDESIIDISNAADKSLNISSDNPVVVPVGDVMYDASLFYRKLGAERIPEDRIINKLNIDGPFRLLTLHRAENTDIEERLLSIFKALIEADDMPIVFPVHPRTAKYLEQYGIELPKHIITIDPVGFYDMLDLEENCFQIVTDSGGVQKEAYFFGKPCITLRDQTEWVETVDAGWNRVVGADTKAVLNALSAKKPEGMQISLYGDGDAGSKILNIIKESRL